MELQYNMAYVVSDQLARPCLIDQLQWDLSCPDTRLVKFQFWKAHFNPTMSSWKVNFYAHGPNLINPRKNQLKSRTLWIQVIPRYVRSLHLKILKKTVMSEQIFYMNHLLLYHVPNGLRNCWLLFQLFNQSQGRAVSKHILWNFTCRKVCFYAHRQEYFQVGKCVFKSFQDTKLAFGK